MMNLWNKLVLIFMTPFEVGQTVTQLPCKHIFNSSAIEKWLKEEQHVCQFVDMN